MVRSEGQFIVLRPTGGRRSPPVRVPSARDLGLEWRLNPERQQIGEIGGTVYCFTPDGRAAVAAGSSAKREGFRVGVAAKS